MSEKEIEKEAKENGLQLLFLRLRNAIADKEACIASGNNELAIYGRWQADWSEGIKQANEEIQSIIDSIKE